MKIVLVGDETFKNRFEECDIYLSLMGHTVYSTISSHPRLKNNPDNQETFELIQLKKILDSDEVVWVSDKTHSINDSTRIQLKWAKLLGKQIKHSDSVDNENYWNVIKNNYPVTKGMNKI